MKCPECNTRMKFNERMDKVRVCGKWECPKCGHTTTVPFESEAHAKVSSKRFFEAQAILKTRRLKNE